VAASTPEIVELAVLLQNFLKAWVDRFQPNCRTWMATAAVASRPDPITVRYVLPGSSDEHSLDLDRGDDFESFFDDLHQRHPDLPLTPAMISVTLHGRALKDRDFAATLRALHGQTPLFRLIRCDSAAFDSAVSQWGYLRLKLVHHLATGPPTAKWCVFMFTPTSILRDTEAKLGINFSSYPVVTFNRIPVSPDDPIVSILHLTERKGLLWPGDLDFDGPGVAVPL
jgi:hypothetical protein